MDKAPWCSRYDFWVGLINGFHPSMFEMVKDCQHSRAATECKGCQYMVEKNQTAHYKEHLWILESEDS